MRWSGRRLKSFWIICLNNCFILVVSLAVAIFAYGFFITPTEKAEAASITDEYLVMSGLDLTSEVATSFTPTEIGKLSAADGSRIQSNGLSWPQGGGYDESKYLEFIFTPDVPEGATIESVSINNNFRRSGSLSGVKLEIWDGQNYISKDISVGQNSTSDIAELIDVSSFINTVAKINNLKVRFLAYRGDGGNTKTSHDFIGLKVTYSESIPDLGTEINNDIVVDTNWTKAGSPYIVNNTITIAKDVTLTIEQGVVIKFDGTADAGIIVEGKISANGTITEPIYFTSSFDDAIGGSTDLDYENCYYQSYTENGTPIGIEICEIFDLNEVAAGDWRGIYFIDSLGSILKNVYFRYGDDTLSFQSSNVDFENLNISDSLNGMFGDEDSSVKITGGAIKNIKGDAITFFDNSSLLLNDVKIENVENGLIGYISNSYKETYPDKQIFDNANIIVTNSNISCKNEGITIFNNYSLKVSNSNILCLEAGITLFNEVKAEINKVKITGAGGAGITSFNITKTDMIKVTESEISNNRYGFMIFNSTFSAHQNYIHDNAGVEVLNGTVDLTSNYWGDQSGPTHLLNPSGVGQVISDNITFKPFLTTNPLVQKTGLSNVMFIPGFQASRLYKMQGDRDAGTLFENKLWEPGILGNVSGMMMNENGESIDDIYTRDIIDQVVIGGIVYKKIYRYLINQMDDLVVHDKIAAWKAIPYDWRYSPNDVVERGIENQEGNISYTQTLTNDQVPYIIKQLESLVESSKSGKVTIVTHSNGGLVAKALIQKLEFLKERGESNLIDKIDNLIIVAAPQLGTAKAIPGLLHGYDQGLGFDLVLSRSKARDFGQNLPGAYGLIPSQKYTEEIENDLILFGESLDKVNNWRNTYGNSINSYSEFRNFLLDNHGLRPEADYSDLRNPVQLNENILNRAENLHLGIDNILIPDNIKVHQLAGWGLPTPYDLRYQSGYKCEVFDKYFCNKKRFVLTSDVGITYQGDEIVVGESALYGEGDNYYLDLNKYNENENNGHDHVSIFETPYVIDFINNILFGNNSVLPEYITNDEPGSYDFTTIKMHSPVAIDIYNEEGLHTGVIENEDPNQNVIEENIPNSIYMGIGEDKYIVVPKEGNYNLKLEGLDDGIFTLSQEQLVNDVPGESVSFVDIPVTKSLRGEANIVSGELIAYIYIDQESDGVFELKILPSTSSEQEPYDDIIEERRKKTGSVRLASSIQNLPSNGINLIDSPEEIKINLPNPIKKANQNIDDSKYSNNLKVVIAEEESDEMIAYTDIVEKSNIDLEENSDRIKWQIIIITGIVVLLLSLKFIFKLI